MKPAKHRSSKLRCNAGPYRQSAVIMPARRIPAVASAALYAMSFDRSDIRPSMDVYTMDNVYLGTVLRIIVDSNYTGQAGSWGGRAGE